MSKRQITLTTREFCEILDLTYDCFLYNIPCAEAITQAMYASKAELLRTVKAMRREVSEERMIRKTNLLMQRGY